MFIQRQTVAAFGPTTHKALSALPKQDAIASIEDSRIQDVRDQLCRNGASDVPASQFGPDWQEQLSMIPGSHRYEVSSSGPRATREVLSFDGESGAVTLTATYADKQFRVFDVIRQDQDGSISHTRDRRVDCQG